MTEGAHIDKSHIERLIDGLNSREELTSMEKLQKLNDFRKFHRAKMDQEALALIQGVIDEYNKECDNKPTLTVVMKDLE